MGEISVLEIVNKHNAEARSIVAMLQDVQDGMNYIPRQALESMCQMLHVPLSRAYSLATFYKAFSLVPKGKYSIKVCMGTACHVRGAPKIAEKLERELRLKRGETSEDLLYSLEDVRCLGCCGLAPVVTVGNDLYGKVSITSIPNIIKKYAKVESIKQS